MTENEWMAKREQIVVLKQGIHTEKELMDFMCEE